MHPDTNELTTRLQHEAARLANRPETEPPLERLFAEHARRRRVKRATLAGGVAACCLLAAGLLHWSERGGDDVIVVLHDAPSTAQPGPTVVDKNPVQPTFPVQQQLTGTSLPDGAVPFLIVEPDGTGSKVIYRGIYIPEQVEEIEYSDLTPAQKRAVHLTIGSEADSFPTEPI